MSTGPYQRWFGRGDIKVRVADPLVVQLLSALHSSMPNCNNKQLLLLFLDLLVVNIAWNGFVCGTARRRVQLVMTTW